jgi:hypothetical protein
MLRTLRTPRALRMPRTPRTSRMPRTPRTSRMPRTPRTSRMPRTPRTSRMPRTPRSPRTPRAPSCTLQFPGFFLMYCIHDKGQGREEFFLYLLYVKGPGSTLFSTHGVSPVHMAKDQAEKNFSCTYAKGPGIEQNFSFYSTFGKGLSRAEFLLYTCEGPGREKFFLFTWQSTKERRIYTVPKAKDHFSFAVHMEKD